MHTRVQSSVDEKVDMPVAAEATSAKPEVWKVDEDTSEIECESSSEIARKKAEEEARKKAEEEAAQKAATMKAEQEAAMKAGAAVKAEQEASAKKAEEESAARAAAAKSVVIPGAEPAAPGNSLLSGMTPQEDFGAFDFGLVIAFPIMIGTLALFFIFPLLRDGLAESLPPVGTP